MDDDDDGSENVAKKMNLCPFKDSNSIASVCTRSISCQMETISPGVELLRTLSRFRKRMENSMSYVHVLHITSHWKVSRNSRAVDVKEG